MDLTSFAQAVEATWISEWLRSSLKALPIVEAIHVVAIATMFGTILIVDLRLLGFPSTSRPYTRVSGELLKWTWGAFALAVVTGLLLFAPNATTYVRNIPLRWKLLFIGLAGINMLVFQLITIKGVAAWDQGKDAPPPAKAAGALSIGLWTTVIFLGRWIGFTKGYDFSVPEDVQLDFDF
jgi:hypothetical protein